MKKQILTLAMCLALTTTAALANGTTAVAKKAPAKAPQKVAKPVLKTTPVAQVKPACEVLTPEQEAKKRFEEKMKAEREHLYTTLALTPEQKANAEAMDQRHREAAKPLFEKIRAERDKLHALKAKNASKIEITKQKHEVRAAKKALRAHFESSRKEFEALLTPAQKTKLSEMEAQRKAERKAERAKYTGCHKPFRSHRANCPCCKKPTEAAPAPAVTPAPATTPAPAPAVKCPCAK